MGERPPRSGRQPGEHPTRSRSPENKEAETFSRSEQASYPEHPPQGQAESSSKQQEQQGSGPPNRNYPRADRSATIQIDTDIDHLANLFANCTITNHDSLDLDVTNLLTLACSNSCVNLTNLSLPVSETNLTCSANNVTPSVCLSSDISTSNVDLIKHNQIDCCVECIHSFYSDFHLVLRELDKVNNTNNVQVVDNDHILSVSRNGPPNPILSTRTAPDINPDPFLGSSGPMTDIAPHKEADKFSYLGKRVINLSKYSLSKSEISLLERGITFAPTPGDADIAEIHSEVNKFIRRILLKLHFHDPDPDLRSAYFNQIPPGLVKFRKPSTWTPRTNDPCVNAFIHNVHKSMSELNPRSRETHNLTKEERSSLNNLKSNGNIVIKKADKGSSIVVMNRSDYISEAERQLSDTNFYQVQTKDLTQEHQDHVNNLVERLFRSEYITEPIYHCLINTKPKTSSLYLLPKIHKITKPGEFPKGRPIISANGSPTERISAFVDENIKGAVPHLPSHIKDTTDFIQKIESINIPEQCLLVTFDVTSLYTNIPNEEGIRAVAKSMIKHKPPYCHPRAIILLLREVLTKNNFEFNGRDYLQVGGTAMGTKLAPSYANIFMGELERKLISGHSKEPFLWFRFIDDIFALWTHDVDELNLFLEYMNQFHDSIKFTMEYSEEQIVFLDTIVKKSECKTKLQVELYTKPTDTHNYLHFNSFHPSHTKRAGPYGQFLRVRRNCTLISDYDKHSLMLKDKYIKRGYPEQLVENSRQKARKLDRAPMLNPDRSKTPNEKNKKDDNVVPLILTYHPSNYQVKKIINDNWGLLKFSDKCLEVLPERPLFATRRNTNLKDALIKSRLNPFAQKGKTGFVDHNLCDPCRFSNCTVCSTLSKMKSFVSQNTLKSFKTPHGVQCTTPNVIYLLTCNICRKQYVGETKRPFVIRLKEHLADIRLKRDKPVAVHINSHNSETKSVIPQIIEVIRRDPELHATTELRKKREVSWIYRLKTLIPQGLNKLS